MAGLDLGGHTAVGAPVAGGRRRSHKLRLVKKKTVRRMLAKKGLKMRGGGEPDTAAEAGVVAGGRRKGHKKTHRKRRGLFHF
jgi:hypothetical protein